MHVDAGGLRLWVEQSGPHDGIPILMCQRMATQAFEWEPALLAGLHGAGYRTIAYDYRGFGWSAPGEGHRYRLMALIDDALGILRALGVERAHVVGSSMGGVVARWLALRCPHAARSLSLFSTSAGDDKVPVWTPEFSAVASNPPGPSVESRVDYILSELRVMCDARFDEAAMRRRAEHAVERGYTRAELGRMMSASNKRTPEEREWQNTTPLHCPAFIVHGTDDKVLTLAHGEGLAELYPAAEFVVIEGMGHEMQPHYVPTVLERWLPFLAHADGRRP